MMTNEELDKHLCETYPKMFVNRHKSPMETCMCWGIDCGSGWSNILSMLCANIQHHITHTRNRRARAIQYNRCLERALRGDAAGLVWYFSYDGAQSSWTDKQVTESIENREFRKVLESVSQVIVQQVKEKFGGLRFYYSGGDDTIAGMVRLAESMSTCTCEECGAPGYRRTGGWIKTLCDEHSKEPEL